MFVLAAGAAVIGFNNFWQFPYLAAQYGGGAFLIVYFFCVLLIGLPLLMAETMLGRGGHASPVGAFRHMARAHGRDPRWALAGGCAVLGGFLILSYLCVIAGWTIAYALRSGLGVFVGLTADGIGSQFAQLVNDPEKQLFWHALFLVSVLAVVGRGMHAGLEAAIRYVSPLLVFLFVVLAVYAATTDGFARALEQLLMPDFEKLGGAGVLAALGHAFFSLGLGSGFVLMYGAYARDEVSVPRLSLWVAAVDTVTALAAGVIVYSVLFSGGVELASGPALVFQALPLAFDHIPMGRIPATALYMLLVLVAWTSAVALAEPVVVWLGERFNLNRVRAVLVCGVSAWVLGLLTIFSFNHWAFSFKFLGLARKLGMFDVLQILTAQILLPLAGILTALFAGWALKPEVTRAALGLRSPCAFDAWLWLVRVAIPAALLLVVFTLSRLLA